MADVSAAPAQAEAPAVAPAPMSHIKLRCTDEERTAINALRAKVADILPIASEYWASDFMLYRFLRARKFDMVKTEAFYRDVIQWRRDVGADTYFQTYKEPEVMARFFAGGLHGVDIDGNAVLIERVGAMDVKGFTESIGEDDFLKWIILYHERQEAQIRALSEAAGEWKLGMTVIADLAGASVRHMAPGVISTAQKRTRLEEDHYPETAKKVFIIRAPRVFAAIYNLVKPMLDEGTREKIVVLGPDYYKTLLTCIPPASIPRCFGGDCACNGDPECSSSVPAGGTVPASLRAGLPASTTIVDVKSGQSDVSHLPVEAGTKITWNFKIQSAKDINFFGFFTPPHVDLENSVSFAKLSETPVGSKLVVSPSRITEGAGEFIASTEGHFTLVWDNTASWLKGKTVMKSVDLIEAAVPAAALATGDVPLAAGAGSDTTGSEEKK